MAEVIDRPTVTHLAGDGGGRSDTRGRADFSGLFAVAARAAMSVSGEVRLPWWRLAAAAKWMWLRSSPQEFRRTAWHGPPYGGKKELTNRRMVVKKIGGHIVTLKVINRLMLWLGS